MQKISTFLTNVKKELYKIDWSKPKNTKYTFFLTIGLFIFFLFIIVLADIGSFQTVQFLRSF